MAGKFLVGAIILLIFLSVCVFHLNKQLRQQEMIVMAQTQVINRLYDNEKLLETIDNERLAFEHRLDEARKGMYNEIRRVLRNDKQAADWADTPIPDSVMRLREANGSCTGGSAPAQK